MTEFWENAYSEGQEIWGLEPSKSALLAKEFFMANKVKNILVPGIGYGRNARVFIDSGIEVTGIEISPTAISLAKKHFGNDLLIYQGSVTEMPFDNKLYDGIFCYAVLHLLDTEDRLKLIRDCYDQLTEKGVMIFATITKQAHSYGQGTCIGKDRYEQFHGAKLFFYDHETIKEEFSESGLSEVSEVIETFPFYLIKCIKRKQNRNQPS